MASKYGCSTRAGKLGTAERDLLPDHAFGLPELRKFPMYRRVGQHVLPDAAHARNAKARASALFHQGGITDTQKSRVDAKADRIIAQCEKSHRGSRASWERAARQHFSYPDQDMSDPTDIGEPPEESMKGGLTRLRYLPPNQAWMFTFGDTPLQLDGENMVYEDRREAVRAARRKGLAVSRSGVVTVDAE
jgi:hypothetical protein